MKNTIYIAVIIILLALIGWLYFNPTKIDTIPTQKKIDSLETIIKDKKTKIDSLKKKVPPLLKQVAFYKKIADSLSDSRNTKPHNCKETVVSQQKEIGYLRQSLEKCEEATTIQTTTIGIQNDIIVNIEMKGVEQLKLHQSALKAEKRKSFLKGAGAMGLVVLVLLLL